MIISGTEAAVALVVLNLIVGWVMDGAPVVVGLGDGG
jgi:Zn-dependent protease